jgi:hypothetical protein
MPPKKQPSTVEVEVRVGVLYHDGKAYPQGAVLEVPAEDARILKARGEAGKPGGLAAERKAQEAEEASRPRCLNCGRILRADMGDPCPLCARALQEPLADLEDYYRSEIPALGGW